MMSTMVTTRGTTSVSTLATTTINRTQQEAWTKEEVMVNVLESDQLYRYTKQPFIQGLMNSTKRRRIALSLTPPIVVVWVYHLARAISEGFVTKL